MKNKRFICFQQYIVENDFVNCDNILNGLEIVIRIVSAINKEEAISKFKKEVNIESNSKLEIVCIELDYLLEIN